MAKKKKRLTTPEAVENHVISLAMKEAEKRIKEGTASSQIITHFVKRGSAKERLSEELMEEKKKMMKAKTDALAASKETKEMYEKAMEAFKEYSGN